MKISEKYASLPVAAIADAAIAALEEKPRLVVTAPPGAGKSTLLPLALLEGLPQGKIIMLEPRRLAARQVAARMAAMLGEPTGETVGYRVRFDTRVSSRTRIEGVTEGSFERLLVDDPTLDGVAAVIFDEFHERSLSSDTALTLTLEAQQVIRQDLRLIIMSATIDAEPLCSGIDASHLHSEGRMHPVDIVYGSDFDPHECHTVVARAIVRAHREQKGDILAFLPGQGEIARCAALLGDSLPDTEILPLYGMLPPEKQRKVLSPPLPGHRRVVLATPVAETSLTIEGVDCVVDSGLCRTLRFDPSSGLSRLVTVPISIDMATQRAGRAGRLRPGICYRLWSRGAEHRMSQCRQPEILSADLAPTLLSIAAWGESNPQRLPWITPPPAGHWAQAASLLHDLGAIDAAGRITSTGHRLAELPCHPRIARMLTEADSPRLACDIAALLEEKDPLDNPADADIDSRIDMLRRKRTGNLSGRWQRIADIAAQYRRMIGCDASPASSVPCDAGSLIALAYPERIAMRAADGRYRLASGEYVTIDEHDPLSRHELLAVASASKRIFLAAPIHRAEAAGAGRWVENVGWDSRSGRAVARTELRVGALVIESRQLDGARRQAITEAICRAVPKHGLTMFDFNDDVQQLQIRVATVAEWHPELNLPPVDTDTLLSTASEWLPLYIADASTVQELRKIDICTVIQGIIGYEASQTVERLAPSHFRLPGGRNARIDYRRGAAAPIVKARLQDCFGLHHTPRLDDGRRPVLMELLSPGYKPVQLTRDLEGFWRTTYFEVRKELRRRYPKHPWP
ncbi:MAG: ATP-dependent helicase HrpB, partial [Muribaculaceae bacterium]|nr:ATP-dependent helicase HrpB [Muribaculaceae bacterium]